MPPPNSPPGQAAGGRLADRIGGRFEPVRLLGRGATSRVDAAWDHLDRRWVALKQLDTATAGDGAAESVEREATLLQRLEHPDIVTVIATGHSGTRAWIAMMLAPGADLSRYTVQSRALPLAVVLRLGERIAQALVHAHGRGVVHRDIKPANVRMHWPSSQLTLLDFGLARGADSAATRTGLVPGSPVYMAPELLAGAMPSPASDLYALGATLFHLLTMRPPHDAPTLGALLQSVAAAPAPRLHTLCLGVSPAFSTLVAQLLARQAHDRPSRAAAVAERLRMEREAVEASPAAERPVSRG